MEITANNIMLITATLLSLSVFVGKAGSRFGMPLLLLFLAVGMIAGSDGFGIHFDSAEVVQLIGMISLSVILFSGGADTRFKDIRPVMGAGLTLATLGVLLTTGITGAFIYVLFSTVAPEFGFGWAESLLLAAIMSSTDSASVFSILSGSRTGLKQNLKPTLELESGSNDPMAYLLVIILIGIIEGGGDISMQTIRDSAWMLTSQLAAGAAGGIAVGYVSVKTINNLKVSNEFLYPVMMIACVFFAFSLTELIGGNSYLAVYIAGLYVGNSKLSLKHTITTFFGGFTWLVQIVMFLSLGLLVNPSELIEPHIVFPGLALGMFMIMVARPAAVFLSLLPFRNFSFKARAYVAWVGLRGAVPIIFATYALTSPDVLHARMMFNMVFFITILSLLVQGTTVNAMAKALRLREPTREKRFNLDLPDEITAAMSEMPVTASLLDSGAYLREITLPPNTLVIMIRRDDRYLVPTGNTRVYLNDTLLLISEKEKELFSFITSHT